MAVDVDSIQHNLLDEIAFREDLDPVYKICKHIFDILRQTRERTGGPSDLVSAQSLRELYPWNVQDDPEGQMPVFPIQTGEEWFYSSKTANHAATDYEFIIASNSITVTLPSQPKLESQVGVRNSDGSTITINGNGKNINARTSIRSKLKGTVLILLYIVETDEWVIT